MGQTVTFQGNPLTLGGETLKVGDKAADFTLVDGELNPVSLADFGGKIKVITTMPSLDTPVCDLQLKAFNKRAMELTGNICIIAVTKDLPFAQGRFCSTNAIDKVTVLSDYKCDAFGRAYGVFIEELSLLSRAVFILDGNNTVCYTQIVSEITKEPDYNAVFSALTESVAK